MSPQESPHIASLHESESGPTLPTWPVQLAAETAEAVFTAQSDLAAGQQFYADVKGRMQKLGRSREHMKIVPACFVVVGYTVEEAQAKRAKLDSLGDYANAIASLSMALGDDASKFDPDRPLPDNIPESNASKRGRQQAIDLGRRAPPHVSHRPLFLAAIFHADVILIVASVPRMIFQTGLLIFAAQFAVLRLLSSRYGVGAERNNQH